VSCRSTVAKRLAFLLSRFCLPRILHLDGQRSQTLQKMLMKYFTLSLMVAIVMGTEDEGTTMKKAFRMGKKISALAKQTSKTLVSVGNTEAEKQEWLDAHNVRRACHGAENLVWDEGMETSANDYIKDKSWDWRKNLAPGVNPHSPGDQRENCGENLAWHWASPPNRIEPTSSVKDWYLEVADCKDFRRKGQRVKDGCVNPEEPGQQVGHFTALIWKTATHLGCAISSNGEAAVCRYRGGKGEHGERRFNPNMQGQYKGNVVDFASNTCRSAAIMENKAGEATKEAWKKYTNREKDFDVVEKAMANQVVARRFFEAASAKVSGQPGVNPDVEVDDAVLVQRDGILVSLDVAPRHETEGPAPEATTMCECIEYAPKDGACSLDFTACKMMGGNSKVNLELKTVSVQGRGRSTSIMTLSYPPNFDSNRPVEQNTCKEVGACVSNPEECTTSCSFV